MKRFFATLLVLAVFAVFMNFTASAGQVEVIRGNQSVAKTAGWISPGYPNGLYDFRYQESQGITNWRQFTHQWQKNIVIANTQSINCLRDDGAWSQVYLDRASGTVLFDSIFTTFYVRLSNSHGIDLAYAKVDLEAWAEQITITDLIKNAVPAKPETVIAYPMQHRAYDGDGHYYKYSLVLNSWDGMENELRIPVRYDDYEYNGGHLFARGELGLDIISQYELDDEVEVSFTVDRKTTNSTDWEVDIPQRTFTIRPALTLGGTLVLGELADVDFDESIPMPTPEPTPVPIPMSLLIQDGQLIKMNGLSMV